MIGIAVFCTARGEPLSPSYLRRLLNRLGEQAGVEKRVHPHGLRRTHAAPLQAEGVEIGISSEQLGTGRSRRRPITSTTSRSGRWCRT